jgi:hypothetical protein
MNKSEIFLKHKAEHKIKIKFPKNENDKRKTEKSYIEFYDETEMKTKLIKVWT